MTVRRSIVPYPSSSRPQRLVASGTDGLPTQRRWRPLVGRPEATHPDGPAGTSSAGDELRPPSAWRGSETTENDGRLLSPVVTVRQLRLSFILVAAAAVVVATAAVVPCTCCPPTADYRRCRPSLVLNFLGVPPSRIVGPRRPHRDCGWRVPGAVP